jgi:hypothetical protein
MQLVVVEVTGVEFPGVGLTTVGTAVWASAPSCPTLQIATTVTRIAKPRMVSSVRAGCEWPNLTTEAPKAGGAQPKCGRISTAGK